MKVGEMLASKGGALWTMEPERTLADAAREMARRDIGSIVVARGRRLLGLATFREVMLALEQGGGSLGGRTLGEAMDSDPPTCSPKSDLDELRRLMLGRHARYVPVLEEGELVGVVSFYDVAKAVVERQDHENSMLRAYINDSPVGAPAQSRAPAELA